MKLIISFFMIFIPLFNTEIIAQEVEIIKFDQLEKIIAEKSDKIKVINFWATWCKPCVAELPYFETINKNNKEVQVILVSLDFPEDIEDRLKPFIKKRGLKSEIKLLDETDGNSWIDKVSPAWTGAIPATLFIDNDSDTQKFIEGEIDGATLKTIIKDLST